MSQNITTRSILKREQVQVDDWIEHSLPAKRDAAYASPITTTRTLYTIAKSDSSSSVWERTRASNKRKNSRVEGSRRARKPVYPHQDRARRPSKRGWRRTQLGYFKIDGRLGIISGLFRIISRLLGDYDTSFVGCTTPAESSICGETLKDEFLYYGFSFRLLSQGSKSCDAIRPNRRTRLGPCLEW